MDDDQLTENIDEEPGPAYAAINLRARAFLIDTAILGGSFIAFVTSRTSSWRATSSRGFLAFPPSWRWLSPEGTRRYTIS